MYNPFGKQLVHQGYIDTNRTARRLQERKERDYNSPHQLELPLNDLEDLFDDVMMPACTFPDALLQDTDWRYTCALKVLQQFPEAYNGCKTIHAKIMIELQNSIQYAWKISHYQTGTCKMQEIITNWAQMFNTCEILFKKALHKLSVYQPSTFQMDDIVENWRIKYNSYMHQRRQCEVCVNKLTTIMKECRPQSKTVLFHCKPRAYPGRPPKIVD